MVYQIKFQESAKKALLKLEKNLQKRIYNSLENKVAKNPFNHLEALCYDKRGLYKHRVGDYRIICEIKNSELVVLVIDLGHRREIYIK